jgi:hypothetical protein
MITRRVVYLFAPPLLAALGGCSISVSSWSLSKSVRSSSHSSDSSSSSSPGAAEEAYRDDVSDYTQAYVKSSTAGDLRGFASAPALGDHDRFRRGSDTVDELETCRLDLDSADPHRTSVSRGERGGKAVRPRGRGCSTTPDV